MPRGVIGRTDDARLVFEIRVNVAHSVGVIAKGDQIDSGIQQGVGVTRVQTADLGGVFSVGNDEVDPMLAADLPQAAV